MKAEELLGQELSGSGPEHAIRCVFPERHIHDDRNKSASFNTDKGTYFCHGCGASGGIKWLAEEIGQPDVVREVLEDLGSLSDNGGPRVRRDRVESPAKDAAATPLPTADEIQAAIEKLQKHKKVLDWFIGKRGINADTLKQFDIGLSSTDERVTIPVRDFDGSLLNVRRYKPQPKDDEPKMLSIKGHGSPWRLYPAERLLGPFNGVLIVCAGELDALLAIQEGLPAITRTTGENSGWNSEAGKAALSVIAQLKLRRIAVIFDCDEAGRKGAKNAACALSSVVSEGTYNVDLDRSRNDGYDLTDYLIEKGAGKLSELIRTTELNPPARLTDNDVNLVTGSAA